MITDVSTSFKRLQAEKLAADSVLRELSPLETMQDVNGLRDYLQNLGLKTEVGVLFMVKEISKTKAAIRYPKMKSSV